MAHGAVAAPIEVVETPTLEQQNLDHLFTDHSSDMDVTLSGFKRKSKFYTPQGEQGVLDNCISPAFQAFANSVAQAHAQNNQVFTNAMGRIVFDCNLNFQVGSNVQGNPTTTVRLVMAVTASGRTKIITAYPL